MDDRDLLELAARAAGIEPLYWNDGLEPYSSGPGIIYGDNWIWNPLTRDGDAFRLAVKLHIGIGFHCDAIAAMHLDSGRSWTEPYSDDQSAATRRAIVRAAAAIAQEMTDVQG